MLMNLYNVYASINTYIYYCASDFKRLYFYHETIKTAFEKKMIFK